MFSLEQNGENGMILLQIDFEQFGTHLKNLNQMYLYFDCMNWILFGYFGKNIL